MRMLLSVQCYAVLQKKKSAIVFLRIYATSSLMIGNGLQSMNPCTQIKRCNIIFGFSGGGKINIIIEQQQT